MPGCASRNCASRRGRKYLAVLTMPTSSGPVFRPRNRATRSSASRIVESTRRVWASRCSPTIVSDTFRLVRSNTGMPTSSSNSLICMETAGGVRFSSSAARAKLRWRATEAKTRIWRSVTFFIKES